MVIGVSYQPIYTITPALLTRVEQIAAVRERIQAATVQVDKLDNFVVTLRQQDGRNRGDTLEARPSGHPASVNEASDNQTTCGFVRAGKVTKLNQF